MERHTTREGNEVRVRPEQLEQALARLAQFEDMAQGLDREQAEIAQRLEQLRSQGREKTVQFRELLAQKLTNQNMKLLLERWKLL